MNPTDKQKYACKMIYNYLHHNKSIKVIRLDSEEFAESLSFQDAFNYIKENQATYENIIQLIQKDRAKKRLNQKSYNYSNSYDNPFSVTDWSDCYDYGIFPWGDS